VANEHGGSRGGGRLVAAGLGVTAFGLAFSVALIVGRGLTGGDLARSLVTPLAVAGGLALGLGVAFVAASEIAQPLGAARAARVLTVAAPLATLVTFLAYSADPAVTVRPPLASGPRAAPLATRPVSPVANGGML